MTDATYIPADRPARRGVLARIWHGLAGSSLGAARLREVEALRALPDAELARRGIPRDRIVQHAFRDVYYV